MQMQVDGKVAEKRERKQGKGRAEHHRGEDGDEATLA